ncbi:AI-2E family transporter [Robiginitomaculum antarcticum]|uniref:AI-2E family transporter n=1 Tax=Robiginitomaculum antarcticum TaxID=437507 RepID=UPI000369D3F1|nr:AI-2E family transporter [Robiginitomaculum antarcticum]
MVTEQRAQQKQPRTPKTVQNGQAPQRYSNWAVVGIFWIMSLGVLTVAQSFFIPVVTAIILALIFSPLRRTMGKVGIKPGLAALLILLSVLAVISVTLYFLAGPIETRIKTLPSLIPNAVKKIEILSGAMEPVIEASDQIDKMSKGADGPAEVVIREGGTLSSIAKTTPRILGQIGFTLAVMMFLISSGDLFYEKLVRVMPTFKDKKRAVVLVKSIEQSVSKYFLTITVINAGLGLAVGLVMWGLGMPDPILFGIGAFLLNFIPFVGAIIGVSLTFLVAFISAPTIVLALLPAVCYFLLTAFEGQFITPMLVGRRLRLNAVVVFLAVAVGAWMWSFMGMFLAIPVLILIKALSDDIESLRGIGEFLGERTGTTRKDQRILDKALEP